MLKLDVPCSWDFVGHITHIDQRQNLIKDSTFRLGYSVDTKKQMLPKESELYHSNQAN